jgi:hypothetical protein
MVVENRSMRLKGLHAFWISGNGEPAKKMHHHSEVLKRPEQRYDFLVAQCLVALGASL